MIYTFEELAAFCESHKLYSFDASLSGKPILLSVPAEFEADSLETQDDDRFLKIHLKACHTQRNANQSFISDEVMLTNKESFHNCPILAHIVKTTNEKGEDSYDFDGHTSELMDDPYNSGEKRINYIERPVGVIPESSDITLEYDKEREKSYVHVDGLIYCEHGNLTASILKEREDVACSVELAVEKMSYDVKDKVLVIEAFKFLGVTLLGMNVAEGMKGSRAYIKYGLTSGENNYSYEDKLLTLLEEIKSDLSRFNIDTITMKGGKHDMSKFEELLKKYNLEKEDIHFDYENMTDTELESAFMKLTDDNQPGDNNNGDDNGKHDGEANDEANGEADNNSAEAGNENDTHENGETYTSGENGDLTVTYRISHEDIKNSLYKLIANSMDTEDAWHLYILQTYADSCIYGLRDKYYRQAHTVDNDVVALSGEPVELFAEFLNIEEKNALEEMRANYSSIKAQLEEYQCRETEEAKSELLSGAEYAIVSKDKEFIKLTENMAKYTTDELKDKADKILFNHLKSKMNFTSKPNTRKSFMMGSTTTDTNKNPFIQGLLELNK